ncbi:DUF6461 domain-containing protein [Streptomyces sp. NPDC059695]|uniref:DUF6461 domain-containing protein n=1 Tax=Streptomyces sp. NPDC059695 TaxID=3346910 RepID=UPI0036A9D5CC
MSDGVAWVDSSGEFELGYWLVFARDVQPVELLRRLGAAAEEAVERTRLEASDIELTSDDIVVRVGSAAGWAYAVVEGGPVGDAGEALREASRGAAAIGLWRTVNADTRFEFAQDGRLVCGFEPEDMAGAFGLAEAAFGVDLPRGDVLTGTLLSGLVTA